MEKSISSDFVHIRGARQNNLKGFDLDLPLGKLNVISGPSGSGKSSFAFDTIYAEGQRRYVETFSPYTRQFLERMDKPRVDEIRGIPPAIAIEQSNPVKTTRSTVGTITQINDYLKLLMPRIAQAFCPSCLRAIAPESAESIIDQVMQKNPDETLLVTFPVPVPPERDPVDFFHFLQKQGYLRVWLGGRAVRTDEPNVERLPAIVPVIQDRSRICRENKSRLIESVETALRFGKGKICFIRETDGAATPYSLGWHCPHCDTEVTPPSPALFSFNNALGACPECRGFGRIIGIDLQRAIPDRELSISAGVVKPFQSERGTECQRDLMRYAARREIDVRLPFAQLPKADQDFVLYGERADMATSSEELWENDRWYGVRGFFDWLETKTYKMHVRVFLSRYRSYTICPSCRGGRFQPATLNFKAHDKTLPELAAMPISALLDLFSKFDMREESAVAMLRHEVISRLKYLAETGLGYLTLDRPTRTLSGGELERVNLTTCLGSGLVNTLFVLDEPSVGLHPRDVGRLIGVMKNLRDKGNTLLVVEHDEAVLRAADNVIELGPGRGEAGGELVFYGPLEELMSSSRDTLTASYLSGRKSIPVPARRRKAQRWIKLKGAAQHNLRGIDVDFPLGVFACVTGVSGSGKSTLVHDVLYQNLLRAKNSASGETAGACETIIGAHQIERVVMVDQSPLSRTPRSNPAVYLGVFDFIRELFAMSPAAREQGLSASSFSFNSGNGRCQRCCGTGFEKIEMQFLSDLYLRCPECDGKRYQPHILKIKLDGKSIDDVLGMTVSEAINLFGGIGQKRIANPLQLLREVGLGYLRLGQPLNVLSGGESQRLKLVGELRQSIEGNRNLLILDEPTTGLHFDDVAQLLKVFERLVERGSTLLVIEHNLEVIKCADYVIDLGPGAGDEGGVLVAKGTPEQVARIAESYTGRFLREYLERPRERHTSSRLNEAPAAAAIARRPEIQICGAREHNLKNISLSLPRDKMLVVTGLSGSGKSTLVFDILFAEGQRQFLDSMSPYARQFVEQLEKPEVDLITGLPPTVAIEQRVTRGGGKSTVATVTEVYHFLRLLFAKLGTQFCPACGLAVEQQSLPAIVKKAESLVRNGPTRLLAPLIKARKGFHTDVAKWAQQHGFSSLLVDGKWHSVENFKKLERFREHTIDVLLGELQRPLQPMLERALEIGRGTAKLLDEKDRLTILSTEMSCPGCGQSFEPLDPRIFSFNSAHGWCQHCHGFGEEWHGVGANGDSALEDELREEREHEWIEQDETEPCAGCNGARLNVVARHVRIGGATIADFTALAAGAALRAFARLKFHGNQAIIARDILPEITQRLQFMEQVGLGYLTLNRSAKTLSGGESQRIRLAAQLGSNLRGVLYILDEPTIGLHPRDNQKLLDTLDALKRKGNSLLVVEHDEDTMRRADAIVDLGPGAGAQGGELVAIGDIETIQQDPRSATGRYLREPLRHPTRGRRRPISRHEQWLEVKNVCVNNLKNISVRFPLGRLCVITGISGSGKSTLMHRVLLPRVKEQLGRGRRKNAGISGAKNLSAVYEVDQSPIGKTSRSTPATYAGVFDEVRKLYAQLPLARMRGYNVGRFSFNNDGGRCESCQGQGVIRVEMNFLPTSFIPCGGCRGKRYNPQTLEVLYSGKSIGDVLEMTIEEARDFFEAHPKIHLTLSLLADTGLGYLKLGQQSPTLSGGESQRLKLVSELRRGAGRDVRSPGQDGGRLYLLEEPTIGLHMSDVQELLKVLHRLVDAGHTVVVIEHNLDLIADADYIVDLGPEAGEQGGRVVACGPPERVAQNKTSRTAVFLRKLLSRRS